MSSQIEADLARILTLVDTLAITMVQGFESL